MKKILFIISMSFVFISQSSIAQNQEWTVSSSSVKFKIRNAGFNVDGTFSGLTAKIFFDAAKGYGNSIDAVIDPATVKTGNSTRDGHLKEAEYFDVAAFPAIRMNATLFGKEANGSFRGYFKLTMKNKTKDVFVPFSFTEKNGIAIFKGEFTINRLDYGVGESSIILSDNATVMVEIFATKK